MTETQTDSLKYLDPKTLTKLSRLDMIARLVVEGFISGRHKSPYHGFSVEFDQHREYVWGDDLRHLDWKVLGKTDRYYIKEYEEETNLRCHILLDISESMAYSGDEVSKLEYGCYVAASLSHMLIQQQDAVGLALFDNELKRHIPAKSSPGHLKGLLHELTTITPKEKTDISLLFHDLAERINRRGMVVVISDLFYDVDRILHGLRHFRHKGHDVLVINVMDNDELRFPFQDMTQFEGLEGYDPLLVNPLSLHEAYLKEVQDFTLALKKGCLSSNCDFVQIDTETPLDVALSAFIASRAKRGRRK